VLDLAIVSAGVMGSRHGRVAMGLRDVRTAFVVDPDGETGGPGTRPGRASSDAAPEDHDPEPRYLEQEHFVRSASGGSSPSVDGRDGLEALELSRAIVERLDVAAGLRT
jgi:predicted dehydrogenase